MGRRKKKQITIKDPETLAVFGVVCLVTSVLLIVSVFVEHPVLSAFKTYFGTGVVVMAVVLFLTALRLFGSENRYNSTKGVISLFIFLLSFLGWIHLFADPYNPFHSQALADAGQYGGKIGYFVASQVSKLSIEAAYALLTIFMLLSFFSALDVSIRQLSEWMVQLFDFVVMLCGKIRDGVVWLVEAFNKSKESIDNLEVNIGSKANGAEEDEEDKKGLLDSFSIKMVSDISGKDKNADAAGNNLNINLKSMANHTGPLRKNVKSSDKEDSLDLTVRNYPDWELPPIDILDPIKEKQQDSKEVIDRKAKAILETLRSFNIQAKILGYSIGPSVTQYFIDPAAGIKFSKIANLSKDLALTLASPSDLRIELVPGKSYIGIDVPNDIRQGTQMKESISPLFENPDEYGLGLAVGIDTQGNPVVKDLQKMPHLLVAGATGMGKSVLVNAFIVSLLMQKTPDELKFIMIDPKMVEMAPYDGIPHLLTPPITDMSKAATALKWAVNEMEERYKVLKEAKVRNIEDYRQQTGELMPYIVIIIDEFADLMMQFRQEVETSIIRIAQKARAVGIHLIVATQRPTADVITGLIRSNIPARVALTVATGIDSRVILDSTGAETLLGKGDLLFKTANDLKPNRIQGLLLPDKGADSEFHRILKFIKEQAPDVEYNDEAILTLPSEGDVDASNFRSEDPLFRQAAEIVIGAQKASASLLQTKMRIGYARAARLVDELETSGIIGPQDGPRPREVLISDLDAFMNARETMGEE